MMSLAIYLQRQSSFVQRTVAFLMLATIVAGVGVSAAVLLPKIHDSQTQWRVAARRELAQLRGWMTNAKNIEAATARLKAEPIWKAFYAVGAEGDVTAVIQRDVTSILNAAGAMNVSMQPLEAATVQTLDAHGVRGSASLDIEQLRAVMVALHSHTPYLRLQGIKVTAPQVDVRNENPILLVALEVVGYTPHVTALPTPTGV